MSAPELETPRLRLRHWIESDLVPFRVMNADPRVMEFFPATLSSKESDDLANRLENELIEKDYGFWAVELKETGEFIGFVGLHGQDFPAPFTPCIEIGWRLAYPFWGKGYATEAAKEALKYAFLTLGLEELVSFTPINNRRSRMVMERLGMKREEGGDFEHPKLEKGHPLRVHVLYRIRPEDIG